MDYYSLELSMYSRRLLLQPPVFHSQPAEPSAQPMTTPALPGGAGDPGSPGSNFDGNVVMILAVLLCALICALGLNSVVRCAIRFTGRGDFDPMTNSVVRLAQTGLRRKVLRALPVLVYSTGLKFTGAAPECTICLSDFVPGERVRVLPKCNHGFHVKCIDRWLAARSSCPTCRRCLFAEFRKASGCVGASPPGGEPVLPIMAPLRREGVVTNYET